MNSLLIAASIGILALSLQPGRAGDFFTFRVGEQPSFTCAVRVGSISVGNLHIDYGMLAGCVRSHSNDAKVQ